MRKGRPVWHQNSPGGWVERRAGRAGGFLLSETHSMKLYFLRHAEAEEGPVDAERELTGKGRRDARRVGRYLRDSGVAFDLAFTSPLVRAGQTAALVLKACPLKGRGRLKTSEALLNDASEAAWKRFLRALPAGKTVLLVGHEPSLSARVRSLMGGLMPTALPLAKGAVARVDSEDLRSGQLRLLVGPKQLP